MRGSHSPVQVSGAGDLDTPVRATVRRVLRGERRDAAITVAFVGPRQMRSINRTHLRHDYPTDVISFALPQPGGATLGDIYVCRFVAAVNARAAGCSLREELLRLVVHGVLHVLGHDHPVNANRTRSPMWRAQERYVKARA